MTKLSADVAAGHRSRPRQLGHPAGRHDQASGDRRLAIAALVGIELYLPPERTSSWLSANYMRNIYSDNSADFSNKIRGHRNGGTT